MSLSFDGTILVPVASPDDAAATAAALEPYLSENSRVIAVNVIEKGGGAPDKASVEQREEYADEIFERTREGLAPTGATLETELCYDTDVVDRILAEAADREVDAVVFRPRESGRFTDLLTGNLSKRLVKEGSVPVVALPRGDA